MIWLICLLHVQDLTWYEHYEEGEKLYQKAAYQEALVHFDAAIQVKPKPQKNVFIRAVQKIEYKPYFYRALCWYRLGQIDRAMENAQLAFQGEVVSLSPNLQFELSPIFQNYSQQIGEVRQQLKMEQELLEARMEISKLLLAGQAEGARARLAELPVSQRGKFADLTQQLESLEAINLRQQNTRTDGLKRVEQFLQANQPALANAALLGVQNLLSENQFNEWNTRIRAAEQNLEHQQTPPAEVDDQLQQEIERGRAQIAELENERLNLRTNLTGLVEENRALQEELQRSQVQTPIQDFPAPSLNLNARVTGLRALDLEGIVFAPAGLDTYQWYLDEERLEPPPALHKNGPLEFRIQDRLKDLAFGAHQIRLEVTDLQGRTSQTAQDFAFLRPVYLKPSFWISLAACLFFMLGLATLLQYRRRMRARLAHFNPYIAGSPILDQKMFFGREDLIRRIQNLVHKNCLMIYGERRMGKTSLLYQLNKALAQADSQQYTFFPAFIDLQGIQEEDLFHHIMAETLSAYPQWRQLALSYTDEAQDYRARQFSRDLKVIIQHLQDQESRHVIVVLLMDEVDVINEFSEKTNQKLRSIFMKDFAEHLSCIMAGIHLKKEWESSGSPWYNFFEEIPMTQLESHSAIELVEKPIRGIFKIERSATQYILQSCGGHPYLIQKLMVSLIARMIQAHKFRIKVEDVKETLSQMKEETDIIQGGHE
ncbi:MAG: AAA family ATPase [Acidobacteria bacterium]|nr:AAA family ATPase [Acidobacteriota bacterium]MCB9397038.1 AAA family ATPase [Acidobacteriota bacterium]